MKWSEYIDSDEVRTAVRVLQDPDGVFEIRAIGTTRKDILSGYFRDAETLLQAFDKIDVRNRNIYITLQQVRDECFARAQSERFLSSTQTTSDTEIVRYRWLFVDLDPVRATGISSSDKELACAELLSEKVAQELSGRGFKAPVKALSGNGYHLLYRIDVMNDADGRMLIERCLKVLSEMFNTSEVKIDTTNSNPSRICKLHGTLAQKGRSTKNRPHRMSRILSVPEKVEVTDTEVLRSLAEELPSDQEVTPSKKNNRVSDFDLLDFMRTNGLSYEEDSNDRATIYKLDECPFDPSHKNGDAKIFLYRNGAIAFKCHHNSCRQYKWQDVRLKYEPNAYDYEADNERIDAGWDKHKQTGQQETSIDVLESPNPKEKIKIRKLKTAHGLMQKQLAEPRVFIGVGAELPILLEGTCILSAKPKLGKSWLALSMCLAVANGEDFLGYHTQKCSTLYLDLETSETLQQKRLRKALHGEPVPENFYLDTETNAIDHGFVEQIRAYLEEDPDIGIVVIDVFQIIRTAARGIKETEYEHAYRDITPLNELAQEKHIAIVLVCHDRKAVDPDDPFSNILGSTGLQGAATQMIVMFRKRKEDPIHISIKGKTIDGLPELDVTLDDAKWEITEKFKSADKESAELDEQYRESDIRNAVLAVTEMTGFWEGRCSDLIYDSVQYGVTIMESARTIGGFLHKQIARFSKYDGIKIEIIDKGTASKMYRFNRLPLSTISNHYDDDDLPLPEYEESSVYGGSEDWYL